MPKTAISNIDSRLRMMIIVVVVLHIVGVVGLATQWRDTFAYLTPFHLLLMAWLLYKANTDRHRSFAIFAGATFMLTFLVEMAGVNTGLIFGEYQYGEVLGPKLINTPVIIGINWFLLACSVGAITSKLNVSRILKVLAASALLTGIDVIIEPVAIGLGFWNWQATDVPIQNYVGWFATSIIVMAIYFGLPFKKENKLAPWILAAQVFFFIALNFLLPAHG